MSTDYGYPGPPLFDPSAEDALPAFGDLIGPPAAPGAAVAAARHGLGLPGAEAPARRQPGADVTGLAESLGLR
jgi:hypothetical protein